MNVICAECAFLRLERIGGIIERTRFNEKNRVKTVVGNARKSFICFECGYKFDINTACATIYAEGEDFRKLLIPSDEIPKYYTEDWGNYGGGQD